MMDLQTIRDMSKQAARVARKERKQPTVFREDQIERAKKGDLSAISGITNLGDLVPKGWKRVRIEGDYPGDAAGFGAYFVDASGFGRPGEAAMTLQEFVKELKPGFGYGLVEVGQFQVKVGMFERKQKCN